MEAGLDNNPDFDQGVSMNGHTSSRVLAVTAAGTDADTTAAGVSSTADDERNAQPKEHNESKKRRAIQSIVRDGNLTESEKRIRIQGVMDGRRSVTSVVSPSCLISTDKELNSAEQDPIASNVASAEVSSAVDLVSTSPKNCIHYQRLCNVVAPCCNAVYGCRICHDEATATQDHGNLDRFKISEIICKKCNHRQPGKTNKCIRCNVKFGEYHCMTCNLWMSMSSKPFHCSKCGLCRVGGRQRYIHCDRCCMCISKSVYETHKCMKEKFKGNCPVCQENLFASRKAPQDLPCGHAIHSHCFRRLASFDYRCPVCKKSVVPPSTMSTVWASRAREIAAQPMPPDLVKVVSILCHDCELRSSDLPWHVLGVQCPGCSSFNTAVDEANRPNDGTGDREGS